MPDYQLGGKVALITGGSGGLGGTISQRLAAEGANLICADIVDASQTIKDLEGEYPEAVRAYQIDMADPAAVDTMMEFILETFGSLDIVVNAAANVGPFCEVVDINDQEIADLVRNNLMSTIVSCRASARIMRKQKSGRIINIASQCGKTAWPHTGVYSATKAGVIALTQALALEMAQDDVRVIAIAPGTMDAPQMYRAFDGMGRLFGEDPEKLIKEKAESMPFGRLGTGEDISRMVAWLASPEASWTVGTALNLSGGENIAY